MTISYPLVGQVLQEPPPSTISNPMAWYFL
jgi:hypothetical protein